MLVAAAVVTWMLFWMRRTAANLRGELHAKIASAHQASLEQSTARPVAAPAGRDACVESLRRFLEAVFG